MMTSLGDDASAVGGAAEEVDLQLVPGGLLFLAHPAGLEVGVLGEHEERRVAKAADVGGLGEVALDAGRLGEARLEVEVAVGSGIARPDAEQARQTEQGG